MYLKRRKNNISKVKLLLLTMLLLLITSFFVMFFLGNKLLPLFINYSESEVKKIITIIIHKSVTKELTDSLKDNNLFMIIKDKENNIQAIDFNTVTVNDFLMKVTHKVQENLREIENGNISLIESYEINIKDFNYKKYRKGVIFEVPAGILFSNVLLNNIGPRIPVRLNLIGNVTSNINTKIKEYGINNSVLNVNLEIKVVEKVILPIISKNIEVMVEVPISIKVIQGKVPEYYAGGLNKNSGMYILPVE